MDGEGNAASANNDYVLVWEKTKGRDGVLPRGSAVKRLQKTNCDTTKNTQGWREPLGERKRMPRRETGLEFRQYHNAFARGPWMQLPPEPTIQRVRYDDAVSDDEATINMMRFVAMARLSSVLRQRG
ncbi:hypothetical protein F4823DRAFT_594014 [Ustulina deusta]|nr:hypothetical protein F4823DRAFT_594014 [Ustulina deusta]